MNAKEQLQIVEEKLQANSMKLESLLKKRDNISIEVKRLEAKIENQLHSKKVLQVKAEVESSEDMKEMIESISI